MPMKALDPFQFSLFRSDILANLLCHLLDFWIQSDIDGVSEALGVQFLRRDRSRTCARSVDGISPESALISGNIVYTYF